MTQILGYKLYNIFDQQQDYIIFVGQHKHSNKQVLIKYFNLKGKTQEQIQNLIESITLQQKIKNPFILPVLNFHIYQNQLIIIHPFCEYGTLDYQIGNNLNIESYIPQQQIQEFLTQILIGLKSIRDEGIICRNITTQNILIKKSKNFKNGQIQLDCFNFAIKTQEQNLQEFNGDLRYQNLQLLKHQQITSKSDIFNIGVVLYKMMTKYFPYTGLTQQMLIKQQEMNRIRNIREICYSDGLKQLTYQMLSKEEQDRPEIEQFNVLNISKVICKINKQISIIVLNKIQKVLVRLNDIFVFKVKNKVNEVLIELGNTLKYIIILRLLIINMNKRFLNQNR